MRTANRLSPRKCAIILVWGWKFSSTKIQNDGDDMATTSITDKLAKLEKKIAKRQATIAEKQAQLDKETEEYPDDVPENIRLQKWGKMYDIFQPACRQCNCAWAYDAKQSAEFCGV